MSKRFAKFRTLHKFGKRRRKKKGKQSPKTQQNSTQTPSLTKTGDVELGETSNESAVEPAQLIPRENPAPSTLRKDAPSAVVFTRKRRHFVSGMKQSPKWQQNSMQSSSLTETGDVEVISLNEYAEHALSIPGEDPVPSTLRENSPSKVVSSRKRKHFECLKGESGMPASETVPVPSKLDTKTQKRTEYTREEVEETSSREGMSKPYVKFRTRHKFGKRRRKKKGKQSAKLQQNSIQTPSSTETRDIEVTSNESPVEPAQLIPGEDQVPSTMRKDHPSAVVSTGKHRRFESGKGNYAETVPVPSKLDSKKQKKRGCAHEEIKETSGRAGGLRMPLHEENKMAE